MASKKLLDSYEQYKAVYELRGAITEVVDAFITLTKYALLTEKEIELGLEIAEYTKNVINESIKKDTKGADFWFFEHWAQDNKKNYEIINKMYQVFKVESYWRFESFMYYMERKRPYDKRFYYPRRKTLGIVVQDLQDLEEDKLDIYGLSMPSRVGKSTIMIFFLAWVGMKKPFSHNAMGGHSGQLVKRFFRGLDNLTDTDEYTFSELFFFWNPRMKKCVQKKSSDPAELTINLGKPDEFATFTCRSIDATWTGAIDVSEDGYLYVDDLVRDREHSLSAFRMENTFQEYQNKMLDRRNDGAKTILVGTLWSVLDPLIREEIRNQGNERARFRKIPALDENDESNFQYEIKGFSTKYFREMREQLDKAEWMAKFQQAPFIRESLVFPAEELVYTEEVPDVEHKVYAFCDTAFGAGDNCSMPVCYDYGEFKIIVDWIHDKRVPDLTVPKIVDKIESHHITWLQVEKNRGGDLFADKIQKEMDARKIHFCRITLKNANVKMHKEERISGYSYFIKSNFRFMKKGSEEYRKALEEMTLFSAEGKNTHDDAADSITGLAEMFEMKSHKKARIYSSLF